MACGGMAGAFRFRERQVELLADPVPAALPKELRRDPAP
jgi:hypothetical protein